MRLEQPNITDEEVEDLIQLFLDKNLDWELTNNANNKAYLRGFGVANLNFVVNNLMSKHWHLLVIEDDGFFITSDNPVSFLLPRPQILNGKHYYECPTFLPISPKRALYIHNYKFLNNIIPISKKQTEFFIEETINHAQNCLYSNVMLIELQKLFDLTPFNLSNLNYKYVFVPYFPLKALNKFALKHFAETRND